MPMTPTAGQVAKLTATLGAGQADYIFPGINWDLKIDGKVVDKSNFRDGRYKVGTLADAELSLTLVWDAAESRRACRIAIHFPLTDPTDIRETAALRPQVAATAISMHDALNERLRLRAKELKTATAT